MVNVRFMWCEKIWIISLSSVCWGESWASHGKSSVRVQDWSISSVLEGLKHSVLLECNCTPDTFTEVISFICSWSVEGIPHHNHTKSRFSLERWRFPTASLWSRLNCPLPKFRPSYNGNLCHFLSKGKLINALLTNDNNIELYYNIIWIL